MMIQSNLFSKGHPLKAEPGLSHVLEGHKQRVVNKIKGISDLDQMTDAFLERLVKDSLVEPLSIQFDKITKKLRTDNLDRSSIPHNSMAGRMVGRFDDADVLGMMGGQKQVARLSIPFTGDPLLLQYAPNPCGMNFPKGEVYDHTIQFDVILWGATPEDAQRAKDDIKRNRELMATYAAAINKQVKEFNESLPAQVKAAFNVKLDELTKQHAIFDDLDIPEEPEPPACSTSPPAPQPKRGKARAIQIIQNIDKMYVQQLNQTNNNIGDVNNAIQSD